MFIELDIVNAFMKGELIWLLIELKSLKIRLKN